MRALKTLTGLALAPAALAALWATALALAPALGKVSATGPLLGGAAACLLLHGLGFGGRLYVAAHELTHAFAAVLVGVKVHKISVKKNSGHVLLGSTNAFISLAPYFIPFYTLAVSALYWVTALFWPVAPYRPWFLGAAGFTLAFHFLHTADILSGPVQSDLKKAGGPVFSLPLLALLNCLALAAALRMLFPGLLSFRAWWAGVLQAQGAVYGALGGAALYVFNTAKIYFKT